MTTPELRAACNSMALTAPVTLDDCRDIYAELKPRLMAGMPLDVMCLDERSIRVTAGLMGSTQSVVMQAKS